MECDARDIRRVALECEHGVRVRALDLVELYGVVAGCGEEAFVRGDAEAVDLRVGMRDGSRADAGEGLPEAERSARSVQIAQTCVPDCVVVARFGKSVDALHSQR